MKKMLALALASVALTSFVACGESGGYKEQKIDATTPAAYKVVFEYFNAANEITQVYGESKDAEGNLWIGRDMDVEGTVDISEQVQLIGTDGKYHGGYQKLDDGSWMKTITGFDLSTSRNFGNMVDDYVFTGTKEKGDATTYLDRPCTTYTIVSVKKEQYNYKSYYDILSTYELIVDDATGIVLQRTLVAYEEDWDNSNRYNPEIGSGYRCTTFDTNPASIRDMVVIEE